MKTWSISRGAKALSLAVAMSAISASSAGAATTLTLTPTNASFGSVNVGNSSAPQSFKLTINCDGFCSASFNPVPSSSIAEFPILNLCPSTINESPIGDDTPSCFIVAFFAPTTAGARTATLSTGAGGPTAALSGTGVAATTPAAQVQTKGKCKKGGKKKSAAAAKKKCKKKKK